MTGFLPMLSDSSPPGGVVRPLWAHLSCHSHQFVSCHPDVAQRKQGKSLCRILHQSAVSHFGVTKLTLDHAKRMLDPGANRRFQQLVSIHHPARLMEKACLKHQIKPDQLILHSDNGSPMKGATMLATLQRLGVVPLFSRPSVSEDNPFSQALFRTLKYVPSYPSKPFTDIEQARQWVHRFVTWYNEEHCHSGIRFVTPAQRHRQLDTAVLMNRHKVYEAAKQRMPERWRNRSTRNLTPIQEVWLNPSNEQPEVAIPN